MSRERSGREASTMVVMSNRDLGLTQAGTYIKNWKTGGRQKGAYSTKRKHWDTVKVFQKPAFRIPVSLAAHCPARRRGREPIAPLPWLEAAIAAGLVEMASRKEASLGGDFVEPLDGQELPYMSRGDLMELLREGVERTVTDLGKEPKKK